MDMSHSPNKDDLMSSTCLHHSKKGKQRSNYTPIIFPLFENKHQ